MSAPDKNLSMENQPKGSAQNLSDTLDRQNEQVPAGQRQWAADSAEKPVEPVDQSPDRLQNASARAGGEAIGGIAPQPEDPTSPAAASARAEAREREMKDSGMGDDGPRSNY